MRSVEYQIVNPDERGFVHIKKACWVVASLLIIACFNSCAVIGRSKDFRPFDESTLKGVTPGKTTAQEVTELFGAPSQVVKLSNGNAYVYERSLSKATGLWLRYSHLCQFRYPA